MQFKSCLIEGSEAEIEVTKVQTTDGKVWEFRQRGLGGEESSLAHSIAFRELKEVPGEEMGDGPRVANRATSYRILFSLGGCEIAPDQPGHDELLTLRKRGGEVWPLEVPLSIENIARLHPDIWVPLAVKVNRLTVPSEAELKN